MEEEWKIIADYPVYEVSSFGNVRRKKSKRPLKKSDNGYGYYTVCLCVGNIKHSKLVHRLVAETFLSNENNLSQVVHKDKNKINNKSDNLQWISAIENADNRIRGATGHKYISNHYKGKFFVKLVNQSFNFTKLCDSLEDAIKVRDAQLNKV